GAARGPSPASASRATRPGDPAGCRAQSREPHPWWPRPSRLPLQPAPLPPLSLHHPLRPARGPTLGRRATARGGVCPVSITGGEVSLDAGNHAQLSPAIVLT